MNISISRNRPTNHPGTVETQLCEVFSRRAKDLFWPAYVLTGSIEDAECCFSHAIDATATKMPTHEAYIYPVARRCVIKAAISVMAGEIHKCAQEEMGDKSADLRSYSCRHLEHFNESSVSIAAMLDSLWLLNAFRRVALVLRVYEKWHRTDAALSLGTSTSLIEIATQRGLSQFLENLGNKQTCRPE